MAPEPSVNSAPEGPRPPGIVLSGPNGAALYVSDCQGIIPAATASQRVPATDLRPASHPKDVSRPCDARSRGAPSKRNSRLPLTGLRDVKVTEREIIKYCWAGPNQFKKQNK